MEKLIKILPTIDSFTQKFDLIVSNPPYITQAEYNTLPIHIKEFEVEIRDTKRGEEELTNEIPNVRSPKKITSSSGFLTGFLNLTIDKAPIIPRDKARLLEITFVITKAIGGNKSPNFASIHLPAVHSISLTL